MTFSVVFLIFHAGNESFVKPFPFVIRTEYWILDRLLSQAHKVNHFFFSSLFQPNPSNFTSIFCESIENGQRIDRKTNFNPKMLWNWIVFNQQIHSGIFRIGGDYRWQSLIAFKWNSKLNSLGIELEQHRRQSTTILNIHFLIHSPLSCLFRYMERLSLCNKILRFSAILFHWISFHLNSAPVLQVACWSVKNKEPNSRRTVIRTKALRQLVKYFVHRMSFYYLFELNIGFKGLRIDTFIYFVLCMRAIVVDPKAFTTNDKYYYYCYYHSHCLV